MRSVRKSLYTITAARETSICERTHQNSSQILLASLSTLRAALCTSQRCETAERTERNRNRRHTKNQKTSGQRKQNNRRDFHIRENERFASE